MPTLMVAVHWVPETEPRSLTWRLRHPRLRALAPVTSEAVGQRQ